MMFVLSLPHLISSEAELWWQLMTAYDVLWQLQFSPFTVSLCPRTLDIRNDQVSRMRIAGGSTGTCYEERVRDDHLVPGGHWNTIQVQKILSRKEQFRPGRRTNKFKEIFRYLPFMSTAPTRICTIKNKFVLCINRASRVWVGSRQASGSGPWLVSAVLSGRRLGVCQSRSRSQHLSLSLRAPQTPSRSLTARTRS